MCRILLVAAFLPAFASAKYTPRPPAGQASFFVFFAMDKNDVISKKRFISEREPVTVEKVVRMGEELKKITVTEYRTVQREVVFSYRLKEMKIRTLKGEEVSLESARKRLVSGKLVMVATEGMKLDPAYLRILSRIGKEDTLVLWQPPMSAK